MVRNRFSKRERIFTPSPTGRAKIYEERILKDGKLGLVKTGEHDLNEFVQASLEGTNVYNILDRFQKTQDPSIFNKVSGFFADVTGMPASLMEAQNLLMDIEKKFDHLPLDVKDKFDNNVNKFADAVVTGTLESFFKKADEVIVDTTDTTVKAEKKGEKE